MVVGEKKFCGGFVEGQDMLGWVRNLIGMGCVCVGGGRCYNLHNVSINYAHAKLIT